jgi:hypothetical protein
MKKIAKNKKLAESGNGFRGRGTVGPRQLPVEGNGFKSPTVRQPKKGARKFGPVG